MADSDSDDGDAATEEDDAEEDGRKMTMSGSTHAAATAALVELVYATHTGGMEGMQRIGNNGDVFELRGGKIAGPIEFKDCNSAPLPLWPVSSPPCSNRTTIKGELPADTTPFAVL